MRCSFDFKRLVQFLLCVGCHVAQVLIIGFVYSSIKSAVLKKNDLAYGFLFTSAILLKRSCSIYKVNFFLAFPQSSFLLCLRDEFTFSVHLVICSALQILHCGI